MVFGYIIIFVLFIRLVYIILEDTKLFDSVMRDDVALGMRIIYRLKNSPEQWISISEINRMFPIVYAPDIKKVLSDLLKENVIVTMHNKYRFFSLDNWDKYRDRRILEIKSEQKG